MTKIVSIIATHNARIRCLLDKILKSEEQFNQLSYRDDDEEEVRIKNCAIIRLVINHTGVKLTMEYEGELDPDEKKSSKRKYYITEKQETKENEVVFNQVFYNEFKLDTLQIKSDDLNNNEYVFYIVRHGQGVHNLAWATHMVLDTDVTPLGKEQALKAGEQLYTIMNQNGDTLNYTFASDLVRTRQPIIGLYEGINTNDNKFKPPDSIIILPCSHELKFVEGNCDSKKESFKIGTRENDSKCSIQDKYTECKVIKLYNTDIEIDWSQYMDENYNNGIIRNMDCSNTNMIKIAIEIINKQKGGKRRRRNKTRKRSKPRSKKSKGGKSGKSGKRSKNKLTGKQKGRTHKK